MSKESNDKVIERIRRLLALAGSPNEHEAAAAALKAQDMLAEYNLSMHDIGQDQSEGFVIDGEFVTDSRPWRRKLAANLAQLYFCDYFFGFVKANTIDRKCGYIRYDRHHFVGAPHNVVVAKSLYAYLLGTIDRLAREGAMKLKMRDRASYMTSFRHACADRLSERLAQKYYDLMHPQAITNDSKNLPALYDDTKQKLKAFLEVKADIRPSVFEPKHRSLLGAMEGAMAGNDVGLDVQVEGGASNHTLSAPKK